MIKDDKYFKLLYHRYLNQSATDSEFDQLFDYLKNPENLELLKREMSQEWQSDQENRDVISPIFWGDIELGIQKRKALEREIKLNRQTRRYWLATAASFLLIVGISILIFLNSKPSEYLTYRTTYGEVEKIALDDGSQVTLNANSTLKWKRNWKAKGERIAILDGEAYFNVETIWDVNHQKTGFDVQTQDLTIQVVGTAFNVKSRTEKTDVFLDEGEVHLDLKSNQSDVSENQSTEVVMAPGESVSYSSKTKKLVRAENDQFGNASWMAGTFTFSDETIADILHSLEDIYGVSFQVSDQIKLDRKLTANLPYSDWPIVQSSLELLLKARLERKENRITIMKRE